MDWLIFFLNLMLGCRLFHIEIKLVALSILVSQFM